jgi:hypothetical protein
VEYRTITSEELKDILLKHKEWLADRSKGEKANLSYADLRSADLRYADLSSANLRYANLRYANLLIFHYQRHVAYFTKLDGMLRIGCHFMPISEWLIGYEELGKADNYSDEEIKVYGLFIKACAELFKGRSE